MAIEEEYHQALLNQVCHCYQKQLPIHFKNLLVQEMMEFLAELLHSHLYLSLSLCHNFSILNVEV